MNNKVEKKVFLGMEVRTVNGEYIVLKDMFSALGRVKSDGTWTNEKTKLLKFLEDIDKTTDHQLLVVTSKGKKQSRESQEVDCLKLDTTPIVLTQFRPVVSNRRSAEENDVALNTWKEFMKFVDVMLTSVEVYKYIVTDKQKQLKHQEVVESLGGKAMRMNVMICEIMAKLIGVEGKIKKDDLRFYQDQTTIDLLGVHEFVVQQFENAYRFTKSHAKAKEMTYMAALEEYPFKAIKSA